MKTLKWPYLLPMLTELMKASLFFAVLRSLVYESLGVSGDLYFFFIAPSLLTGAIVFALLFLGLDGGKLLLPLATVQKGLCVLAMPFLFRQAAALGVSHFRGNVTETIFFLLFCIVDFIFLVYLLLLQMTARGRKNAPLPEFKESEMEE